MAYLFAILTTFILLGGFLALMRFETNRGTRFFGDVRARLDTRVERATFVVRHVDWSAVLSEMVRSIAARIVHDVAHGVLILVRILERLLTRVVKYLRTSRQQAAAVSDRKKFDMRASFANFRATLKRAKEENQEM